MKNKKRNLKDWYVAHYAKMSDKELLLQKKLVDNGDLINNFLKKGYIYEELEFRNYQEFEVIKATDGGFTINDKKIK